MKKINQLLILLFFVLFSCITVMGQKAEIIEKNQPKVQWFRDAKFGMFIHWGLYSELAGTWKGKNYYGSGEWIMNQAKIPAKEYAKVASEFNPVDFNADEWATLAKDAGIKYMVITAKHHEGFSMFDSKVTKFDIVDASPFKRDPMKELSIACRKAGIKFGFYYSQFLDWHEPNGGGNNWDFDENKKDYQKYYQQKAIPQLKELLSNYGPLGIVWFDQPGGLTKAQTKQMIDSLRVLQPNALFSSRVGYDLGDYKDFGDSETPPSPIEDAWEAIYTHNDSWGYIKHDMNFKSTKEIIQLLANVVSKGGNLMLNVGPDGKGNIPYYSIKYLRETGKWLNVNGESIYGTTYGFIAPQPWGVTSSKPGKLFLHVFAQPLNNKLLVPGFRNPVTKVYALSDKKEMKWVKSGHDLFIDIPPGKSSPDKVFVVEYTGAKPAFDASVPVTVSSQFQVNNINAISAEVSGNTHIESLTFSHYFGDWKHETCITGEKNPGDIAAFRVRVTDPGDYKLILEYACAKESANQEGSIKMNGQEFFFRTLHTGEFNQNEPLMFIKHPVAVTTIKNPGVYTITIQPLQEGKELFKLKAVQLEPLN